jgi:hypothetical protein
MPTIEVIRAQPPHLGQCGGCERAIEWVTTVKQGRSMPVETPLVVEREHVRLDNSVVTVIDGGQSHFAHCREAARFRKRR